jgi:ferredoxin/flavodoxin---NADP+ reductase
MYLIVRKEVLSSAVTLMEVKAPLVARRPQPGQFAIFRLDETGERFPLTIAGHDPAAGTITIVFQTVGKSTHRLAQFEVGQEIIDVVGPLGVASEIENFGAVACLGGGVGIAFIYPEIAALYRAGNRITSILGARNESLLFYLQEIKAVSTEVHITTDDGSAGRKGLVIDVLREQIEAGRKFDRVIAAGPVPMMRAVTEVTRPYGIPTIVSLDPIMVDGTGMCGACRVTVGGETKFACVDGPNFDAHQVDFDELMSRKRGFAELEKHAYHECRALQQAKEQKE